MDNLVFDVEKDKLPIVYDKIYNISFWGLERMHPFDSSKWGRIIEYLIEDKFMDGTNYIHPKEASEEHLLTVHTQRYLNSLKYSATVAGVTEVIPVAFLPNFLVQRKVLKPLRYQTGGTVIAAKISLERGWSFNVGGGFHHCSSDSGGGFCAYADITIAIKYLLDHVENVSKVLIIDLDAHQGNGHENDFLKEKRVYIMDVYNAYIYPGDSKAKKGISRNIPLDHFTEDEQYLELVERHFEEALNEFRPDFILYNAGTDILMGDPLGMLNITPNGVVKRDEIVFHAARSRNIPITMVTSGGYQRKTARVIADSILNLHQCGLLKQNEEVKSKIS